MSENFNQPREYDAVLGGKIPPPKDGVVLGGIAGVKRRLTSAVSVEEQVLAVAEALKYGEAGIRLVFEIINPESEKLQLTISSLLGQQALAKLQSSLDTEPPLISAVGINYSNLQKLLTAGKWRDADQETAAMMLQICDRTQQGCLDPTDIEKFPCADLNIIETLWQKSSNGRFGFAVQTYIWQKVGGTANPDWEAWCRFGKGVGWFSQGSWRYWNDLQFDLNASVGHLPRGGAFIGWGLGDFWTGCRTLSALAEKLARCNII
ncbi:GUN4 domain-containing protein [Nostoc spongiaeforme FACHB-130]|uniref:GUN4 domain-containing protein n=1 Tax=Nostoc spongiaeforme FACHB-130 TaxID=1357510 RepID=A0ABR8G409_9NOSO|nr:GUN4 domain-containing protein [Nostoc spongiaeforme]MBD2597936.1 GUN4 domain-containing protein [Nostoc spongiaeforme FACHB-130]